MADYRHLSRNQEAKKALFEDNSPDAMTERLALHELGLHSECDLHTLRFSPPRCPTTTRN